MPVKFSSWYFVYIAGNQIQLQRQPKTIMAIYAKAVGILIHILLLSTLFLLKMLKLF